MERYTVNSCTKSRGVVMWSIKDNGYLLGDVSTEADARNIARRLNAAAALLDAEKALADANAVLCEADPQSEDAETLASMREHRMRCVGDRAFAMGRAKVAFT